MYRCYTTRHKKLLDLQYSTVKGEGFCLQMQCICWTWIPIPGSVWRVSTCKFSGRKCGAACPLCWLNAEISVRRKKFTGENDEAALAVVRVQWLSRAEVFPKAGRTFAGPPSCMLLITLVSVGGVRTVLHQCYYSKTQFRSDETRRQWNAVDSVTDDTYALCCIPSRITFFFFFLIPFIFSPFFSLPPSRNSNPGSHSGLFSLLPTHYGSWLAFLSQDLALSSLVESRRITLTHAQWWTPSSKTGRSVFCEIPSARI